MSSRNKSNVKKLFEFWCEVKHPHDAQDGTGGIIVEQFPKSFRDEKTKADIPVFAFPCEFSKSDSVQSFSFVLTTDDSKWRYGFCRQDPETSSAMVIVTYLPWHDTFLKLLIVLAELQRCNNGALEHFLQEAYNHGIPDPGGSLTLFYHGGQKSFVFERPMEFQLPSIPKNYNLNLYYNFVDPKNMIAVFAAMLAERRIIFTSYRLDRLSSCIQAANAFLFPMVWQHIFIPVLPMKLKDYLSAPMPYLIGVPKMVLETMSPEELGEVVILNCDTKICESPFDDVHEMPTEIVSYMKKQLSHTHEHIGDRVSKIFLGVLVQLIGGYRDAVEFHDKEKTFNREKFIETRPSHLRPFLTKMMELQIFQQFIDERLEMLNAGLGFSDEFELEIARYTEKMKRGRNYGFLKNVKEKTNPAVKSAVKSVKEGSRGMKTAYKDLKSKFRDITPPNSNTHFRSHLPPTGPHKDRLDGIGIGSAGGGVGGSGGFSKSKPHCSAPSSPVFSKHVMSTQSFQYASPEAITNASHGLRRPVPIVGSSSNMQLHPNENSSAKFSMLSASAALGASPSISPANSECSSSDMNLSQELQNHPLFKVPAADRSSLPTLRNNCSPASPTNQNHAFNSATTRENSNDLITLDDSSNASFDLEDFDPLNQNARPLPIDKGKVQMDLHKQKSTTLPATNYSALMANNLLASVTPTTATTNAQSNFNKHHHYMANSQPPPLPTSLPPSMVPVNEDFELLRKYGLDQFSLTTATPTAGMNNIKPGTSNGTAYTANGINNWATFD